MSSHKNTGKEKTVEELESNFVDIEAREIYPVQLKIAEGKIIAIKRIQKRCETYILPGFIDAHVHIESSMLIPTEFARMAVCHGTVATISDPHEIANVLGVAGVDYMLQNAKKTPFKFYFGASPCVPATPYETNGATLDPDAVASLLARDDIYFLSEVMNFPGVIAGDEDMLRKIAAAKAVGKPIDGHAPGLRGKDLDIYIGAGITTDHEAFTYEEGLEKIQKGMKILIREGSAAKNFDALEPLIASYWKQMMFCSDDCHPNDLRNGHINEMVKRAIAKGNDLFHVLQMACLNPIHHYNIDVGTLHAGDSADFIEVADLKNFTHIRTVIKGIEVAKRGETRLSSIQETTPNYFECTLKNEKDFKLPPCHGKREVIEAVEHQLVTHEDKIDMKEEAEYDLSSDILKIAVVNRYKNAPAAVANIRGFGLKEGAIVSSIAHDSHNIVVVGCSDEAITKAVNGIIKMRGGIGAVSEGKFHRLPLPVAGLMSAENAFDIATQYETIDRFVKNSLGSKLESPFMTLSFMALLVIPELKLSDKGLFDVRKFHFIGECDTEGGPDRESLPEESQSSKSK